MANRIKYGLFEYHTENIGDEIQSIAARRFLPRIDYYFDRDNINAIELPPNETVKIIMNGWYTHHPENWPPENLNLKPLLIAMHIEQDALNGMAAKAFISDKSKTFLNKFAPVGARNYPTLKLLQNNHIESYFSGCVTLTLNPDQRVKKKDFILAVDVPDNVYKTMLKNTLRPVIRLNTNHQTSLSRETRFLLAELWLYLYQSAHAVITTRLHSMLPCLALNTPVLALSGRDPKRYEGLINLTRHVTPSEYIKNPSIFNLNHPPKNPSSYLHLRKQLEKTCKDFTNYDSSESYLENKKPKDLLEDPRLMQFFLNATFDTWLLECTKNQISTLENQLSSLKNQPVIHQTPTAPLGIKASVASLARAIKHKITNN